MIACGRGGAIKTIKEAPKLKSKKVDRLFLASIFRSLTEKVISRDLIEGEIQKAVDEANSCSDEILKRTREDLADLRKAVADFERISGFRITTWPEDNQKLAKTIKDVFDGKYGTADEEIKKLRKSALNIAACRQAEAEFGRERDKLWKMIDRGFAHVSEIQKIVEAATKERLSFRKESAPAPTFPEL